MFRKILAFGVRRSLTGAGKPWLMYSGGLMAMRMFKSVTSKTEVIDLSNTKPGDKIVIEHLGVTHRDQLKEEKASKKADKRAAKQAQKPTRRAARRG